MGIKGLTKFIHVFEKSVIDRIQMRNEIENWKMDHGGDPTIIIDLKEAINIFVQRDETGVVLGGRYNIYNLKLKQLLAELKKTNAKLVFFFSAKKYTDQLTFFIPKREDDYINNLKILDAIDDGRDLKEFLAEKNRRSPDIRMPFAMEYNLKTIVQDFGELHINYVLHNQEIARYIKQHADEVLAVISNDSDFMAFEGDFQYWKANSLNFRELTCIRYCKNKLREKVGLDCHQMQLLSALCGSNYLPVYVITDFLNGLIEVSGCSSKILNVAEYVKKQPMQMIRNKPKYDLESISRDVFGKEYTVEQLNSIQNGLQCYDLEFSDGPAFTNGFLNFCKKREMFMYVLATDEVLKVKDIAFIDFRNYRSKTYCELIMPILMKLCGVLCGEKTRRPVVRKVCMKHAHDEPFRMTEENIIYPPMKLPDRFDLIFKNREHELDEVRWSLLEWILDLETGFTKKLNHNKNLRLDSIILTLQYLVQNEELSPKEANAILYTENKVRNQRWSKVQYPSRLDTHFVRVAHLYVKMLVLISYSLEVCGLKNRTDLLKFDGAEFHYIMAKFNSATEEQMAVLMSSIIPIWSFS